MQKHPLDVHEPGATDSIRFVRLESLLALESPIPRSQGLPASAFGKLTSRGALVGLSHGWFFRRHPDPSAPS